MWGAIIGAVGTYLGGRQAKKGGDKAADATLQGTKLGIEEMRRQYDLSRGDMLPFLQFGQSAIPKQQAFLNGDWSGFENSPDYKYALAEGLGAIDKSAAARGGLFGGGNTRDLTRFATGLATQNADNYWNKLAGVSGMGQTTASGLGSLGADMARGVASNYNTGAQARASAYQNRGDINAGMWSLFGRGLNDWYQQNSVRNGGGSGWYLGQKPGPG